MKLKKLQKIFAGYESIIIWGKDENEPVWKGIVDDIPYSLINEKLVKSSIDSYVEIRSNHPKAGVHIAVFIDES